MTEEYEGYLIEVAKGRGSLVQIKAKGKGSVVKSLRGLYTSSRDAKRAIDTYLRGKTNGKTKSAS